MEKIGDFIKEIQYMPLNEQAIVIIALLLFVVVLAFIVSGIVSCLIFYLRVKPKINKMTEEERKNILVIDGDYYLYENGDHIKI